MVRDETRVKKRVRFNNLSSRRDRTVEEEEYDEEDINTSMTSRIETEDDFDGNRVSVCRYYGLFRVFN